MSGHVGQREIHTQNAVIRFLQAALGYAYLGHWRHREGNGNIQQERRHNQFFGIRGRW